jgi:ferric-dicitrate binding protein FerR (iron transport regulator)
MNREQEDRARSQALADLVEEAREASPEELEKSAGIDWDRVDASLFARVEREAEKTRALAAHRGRPGAWLLLGGIAAAAAAAAVFMQPSVHSAAPASFATVSGSAGDLTLQKGPGDVLLDGAKARAGTLARTGDTIGTHGAKAVFEAQGRVSWLLEDESSVKVERAGAPGTPVVLALREGAIEAEVVPVASGEAFAVDIDGIRVAVHGTHLRVAREGDRVIVDLSEGVVSIGAPPKSGSTYGTLVTAPAHVEFHADALGSSLTVDHLSTSVRRAADLDSVMDEETSASVTPPSRPQVRDDDHVTPAPARALPSAPRTRAAVASTSPEETLAKAIRACAAAEPHTTSGSLTAMFHSKLTFDLNAEHHVENALYEPPIGIGSMHACVTQAAYSARFVEPGHYEIPISFQLP